ncbi:MAG: phosphomannomutase CpsG, partial [Pseudomonadota bacterium]
MSAPLTCFKAYDVRGKLGEDLNEDICYRIGRAYTQFTNARNVVLGSDVRASSNLLKQALALGIIDSGGNVIDIGQTGTEEVYFASFFLDVDGGIEVTASHNPIDYNGMKFVGKGAKPISGDSGLRKIQQLAETNSFKDVTQRGAISKTSILEPYIDHLLSYININNLKPLKIATNAGNGTAGHVIDAIEQQFNKHDVAIEF